MGKYLSTQDLEEINLDFHQIIFLKITNNIWRLHFTSQNIFNQENGGLDPDSIYFFEQAPDYFVLDEYGDQIINEDGSYEMMYYDGYLDRSRLGPMDFSESSLYSKSFFSDFKRSINWRTKKKTSFPLVINSPMNIRNLNILKHLQLQFLEKPKLDGVVIDRSRIYFQENKIYLESDIIN